MHADANKALVQRLITEAWNNHNLTVLDDLVADPACYRTAITALRTAYPDLHMTIDQIIAEGDWVAYRWTAQGTHELGTQLCWTGMTFNRIQDGKIVDACFEADRLTLLEQLGIVPAMLTSQRPSSRVVPTA